MKQLLTTVPCSAIPAAVELREPAGPCGADSNHNDRLRRLRDRIRRDPAHFGIWIDGNGKRCLLLDEHGEPIASDRIVLTLAMTIVERKASTIIVEEGLRNLSLTSSALFEVQTANFSRLAMHAAMDQSGAIVRGGRSGPYWFQHVVPLPDALRFLAHLLGRPQQQRPHDQSGTLKCPHA